MLTSARVLVDAHMVGTGETGNETYVANLLAQLSDMESIRAGAAILPGNRSSHAWPRADVIRLGSSHNLSRLLYHLPRACVSWKADILHVTYVAPLWSPCPFVVSFHDASFKRYSGFFSPRDRLLFATLLPLTLRRASAVITLSSHAMREILAFYPYLSGRVFVTPAAANSLFREVDKIDAAREVGLRYGIRSDFVLAVGNLQPRKNLVRLVEAYAAVRDRVTRLQLVVAGKAQWRSSDVFEAVRRHGLEEHVIFTGYVPDDDLVLLYNAARAFAYPSLYEGFGLPVLEAMACGTPVITSNSSSLPEVAGSAALLVDPTRVDVIAQGILSVLTDRELASSLAAEGLHRAAQFSWRRTAQATAAVYEKVLA